MNTLDELQLLADGKTSIYGSIVVAQAARDEISALQPVYAAAKHHIDVRLPADSGFDEAVFAADKYYETTASGSPTPPHGAAITVDDDGKIRTILDDPADQRQEPDNE